MNKKGKYMNRKILKLLYRSFDDDLDEKEQKQLAEALENSANLKQEKERISRLRQNVTDTAAQSFGPFFAERVMNRIDSENKKEYSPEIFYEALRSVFQRIAIAGTIVMIALISYNLIIGESLPVEEFFYISEMTFEDILQLPLF